MLLSVENLHVYYGAIHAVKDVSLHVQEGEIVTLIGANGAGKSTVLNTISGLLKPRSGKIQFMDHNVTGVAPNKIVQTGLVQCPEGRRVFARMTVEENLEMEKMDIAFIADKMCMSHSTLYRKIKGLTDMSANEFIRKVKMRKGVELLMSGQYTISEIAYMIGFSSVAYFRQCFKDEYGMSPSDYVKQKQ